VPLLVECSQNPEELDADQFVEPGFEHAHTLERMRWLCGRAPAMDTRHAPTARSTTRSWPPPGRQAASCRSSLPRGQARPRR
jgi:hypothetical protein